MELKQRKRNRLVRGLMWLVTLGTVLLILLPIWFPWLLVPVLAHYGLRFKDYDRIGYTRFALTGVHASWNATSLAVQRVEAALPATWIWRQLNGHTNAPLLLSLSGGHLWVGKSTTNPSATTGAELNESTDEVLNQILRNGALLRQFLPVAGLTNCSIEIASNKVSIPYAIWRAGRLHAVVGIPSSRGEIKVDGRIGGDMTLELAGRWEAYDASLSGGFSRTLTGWRWEGDLRWHTNHADIMAQFATNGWLPVQAKIDCRRWGISANSIEAAGYENLVATLTGNLASNRFELQATGFARPLPESAARGYPIVNFSLGADGDPEELRLHTFNIQSPWFHADLTNTLTSTWRGEILPAPGQFRFSVDLRKLPGAKLTGQVAGEVRIEQREAKLPVVQFRCSSGPVTAGPLDVKNVSVRGEFAAPFLRLAEIRADFPDGSKLVAEGAFDTKAGHILDAHWKLSGGFLEQLLPGFRYAGLAAAGELQGPLTNVTHRGEISLTNCRAAGLKAFDVHLPWTGQNQRVAVDHAEITAGKSGLSIGGVADLNAQEIGIAATLTQFALHRGQETLYTLHSPCAAKFRAGQTNAPGQAWKIAVDAFDWRNDRHTMYLATDLAWPASGNATLTMSNVTFADFSDFLEMDATNILLTQLALTANWSNGPVQSVFSTTGWVTNRTGQVFSLHGNVKTDQILEIKQLTVGNDLLPTFSLAGKIPVKVIPGVTDGLLIWDQSDTIALVGKWKEDLVKNFSIPMGVWGQLEVVRPEVNFRISGAPQAPWAELTAAVKTLAWLPKTNDSQLPKLEDLQLAAEIRPDAIRLKAFSAKLEDQKVAANGEWPLPQEAWRQFWSAGKLPDWTRAQGRLELEKARLAAIATYLPPVVAPEGRLSATLELKAGKHLEGVLSLTNAAMRATGTMTPLRDISARVRLEGERAVLEDFRGQIGGQPIRADGAVTIPELGGSGLEYLVRLHGTNVPLARSPELLLRGDFQLSLHAVSNLPPVISGDITLRDGLFVQHASALVWSAPKRPEWQPPYFSVTNPPFADWKLDLTVRGDRFLRTRTPVFSGIVSADFQLKGSLATPLLTGDARVSAGRLVFPFGALTLNQGFVSFSGNDPKGPDLQVNASGRNYRYDLRLEVKGPIDGANVIFSSTPPLTSEQILLMLTAGEMPASDFTFSSGARAGRLGTFLGTDLLSRYLGSDPTEERLIIRTGESISEAGRLTYSVEYRLSNRWSIIGEYDEFNAFNTDLKWKIFTR